MAKVVNGPSLLQQAAVDAAKQWRFSNPLNAPVTIRVTLAFTLHPDSETENQTKARGTLRNTHKVDATYPEEANWIAVLALTEPNRDR